MTIEQLSEGLLRYERLHKLDSQLTRHAHCKLPPVQLAAKSGSVLESYQYENVNVASMQTGFTMR